MTSVPSFTFPDASRIKKSFPESNLLNFQFLNRREIIDSLAKALQHQPRTFIKELELTIQEVIVKRDARSIILLHKLTHALIKISESTVLGVK